MNASTVIFYLIAGLIIGGGIFAVTARKIFRAAIYLLFSLIGIAALYFYLNYEFIAAVQVVVYVGGIVVLIIFSIFLTHASGDEMQKPLLWRSIFSALATLFATCLTLLFILKHPFVASTQAPIEASVHTIGLQLLSTTQHGFILPFEVVSLLLLAALIGCIVIAMKIKSKV
ncbi:MAG: NADH-quinone oxidoreductase subunit J [Bacteroidetes bacterium]|nr:NADH-quinone oxidoreductase subunit J [Bacteroidota bacterium]